MSGTNTFTFVTQATSLSRRFSLDGMTNYSPSDEYSTHRSNHLVPMHETYQVNHGRIEDARQRLQEAKNKLRTLHQAVKMAEKEVWAAKTEYSRVNEKCTNAVRAQGNLHMRARGKDFGAWWEANKHTVLSPDVIAFLSSDP